MITKLVSNVLLSVIMDKKARKKFNAIREQTSSPISKRLFKTKIKPAEEQFEHSSQTSEEEAVKLIKRNPEKRSKHPIGAMMEKSAKGERKALIERAVAIHREKSYVLDGISQDDKDKLATIAIKLLG